MNRRILFQMMLALLIAGGTPLLTGVLGSEFGAALADSGSDDGGSDDGGSDDGGSDDGGSDDSGSDDSGSDDDGSDDGGSDDSGSDDGGSDDSGSDDGGSSNSGSSNSGSGSSNSSSNSGNTGTRRTFGDDTIRLNYANGAVERIIADQYEHIDAQGRVLERRRARTTDRNRLSKMRDQITTGGAKAGVQSAIVVNSRSDAMQITDIAGWSEVVVNGRYSLTDPNGNVVAKRRATSKDIARIRGVLGLR